jgi:ribosomal subunit interface protein
MQQEPEITFHNLDNSPALEAEIRSRIDKLDRLYDRLVGVRVSIEALHNQHRTGNIHECHITLMVPGSDLVVSRKPHKAKEKYQNPDIYTAVRDAFQAAERQLKEYKEKQSGEVKRHVPLMQGQVAEVNKEAGFGYVLTAEGQLLYFSQSAVLAGDFDQYERGDVVHYVQVEGETGPSASKVWRGSEHDLDKMR